MTKAKPIDRLALTRSKFGERDTASAQAVGKRR